MTWDLRGPFPLPRKGKNKQNRENRTKEREGKKGLHGNMKRTCTDDLGLKGPFFFAERTNRTGIKDRGIGLPGLFFFAEEEGKRGLRGRRLKTRKRKGETEMH